MEGGGGGGGADLLGLLCSLSGRIQWEHSAGAAGLFEMRRAGGADRHSTELKDFFSGSSATRVPLIGWTTSQPFRNLSLIDGGGEARYARKREFRTNSAGAQRGGSRLETWADASTDQHAPVL